MSLKWDIFVSYAHEDKEDVARPLADHLDRQGLRVWFDEYQLEVGDSLVEAVGSGLRDSRYGLVIISPAFIAKTWTINELNSLFSLENSPQRRILPVWHQIEIDQVREFNPLLADRVALRTSDGLDTIVRRVVTKFPQLAYIDASGPLAGYWSGSSGRLLIRHEDDLVMGDYDWHGKPWIGNLEGTIYEGVLNFSWSWTGISGKCGRGLFRHAIVGGYRNPDDNDQMLVGAWWHDGTKVDVPELLAELRSPDPWAMAGVPVVQNEGVFPWSFGFDPWRTKKRSELDTAPNSSAAPDGWRRR